LIRDFSTAANAENAEKKKERKKKKILSELCALRS